jgi:tetratricopeptide (TPR) repeat protein
VIKSDSIFQQYEWPIFLDSKSKLSTSLQRDWNGFDVKKKLSEAINNFELALKFPNYTMGNLNLSIAHLLFEISREEEGIKHLKKSKNYLSELEDNGLAQLVTMEGIIQHFEKDFEKSKQTFISNAESFSLSKRNLDKLFFQIQPVDDAQNPLNKILKSDVNLGDLFFNDKNVIKDNLTKLLTFFSSTTLEKLNLDEKSCYKFSDRSIQNSSDKSIHLAEWKKGFEYITETQLISFSDQIFHTNLYRYYTYKGWVVRFDMNNRKTIYITQ